MSVRNDEAQQCANTNRASNVSNPCEKTNMNIVAKSEFKFKGVQLSPVKSMEGIWFTSADLAKALEYSNSRAVTKIFNKYADEFTNCMTQVLEMSTSGNYRKKVRVFSLRGAHLIAMFARTDVAKEFRRWVLDILDQEAAQQNVAPMFSGRVLLNFEQGELVMTRVAREDEQLVSAKTTIELFKQRGYVLVNKDELTSKVTNALQGL